MQTTLNVVRIGALFLIVAVAVMLYQAATQTAPATDSETSLSAETPVIGRIAPDLLIINNTLFQLELADTPDARNRGLSDRDKLDPNQGLLFIFDQPGKWGFWMKDMRFPIDIIWFDHRFRVVHVVANADPSSYPTTFYPPKPALYVLELPAGAWQEAILSTN